MEVVVDSLELAVEASAKNAQDSLEAMLQTLKSIREEVSRTINELRGMPNALSGATAAANASSSSKSGGGRKSGYAKLKRDIESADNAIASSQISGVREAAHATKEIVDEISEAREQIGSTVSGMSRVADEAEQVKTVITEIPKQLTDSVHMADELCTSLQEAANIANRIMLYNEPLRGWVVDDIPPSPAFSLPEFSTDSFIDVSFVDVVDEAEQFNDVMSEVRDSVEGVYEWIRRTGDEINRTTGHTHRLWASIKRIAMYRAIRAVLKAITDGIKEGVNNLYQYSKAFGGHFSKTMDKCSSSIKSFKNSVGVAVAPLIERFAPAIDWTTDKLITLNNLISKVGAALRGETSYTIAKRYATEYAEAAEDAAKATKDFTLGFDELNVINPNSAGNNSGVDYSEMFEEATMTNGEMIKLREKFEDILTTAKAIGAVLLTWKVSQGLMDFIGLLKNEAGLRKNVGITLMIAGGILEFSGAFELGYGNVSWENIFKTGLGSALLVGGSLLTFGTGPAGWAIGLTAALTVGLIGYFKGKEAKLQEQYENSEAYKEIQSIMADLSEKREIVKEINVSIKASYDNYNDITTEYDSYRKMVDDLFEMVDKVDKTPEDLSLIQEYIKNLNKLDLGDVTLQFDDMKDSINLTKEEVIHLIDNLEELAKKQALQDMLTENYKAQIENEQVLEGLYAQQKQNSANWKEEKQRCSELESEYHEVSEKINEMTSKYGLLGIMFSGKLYPEYKELKDRQKQLSEEWEMSQMVLSGYGETLGETLRATVEAEETAKRLGEQQKFIKDRLSDTVPVIREYYIPAMEDAGEATKNTTSYTSDLGTGFDTLKAKSKNAASEVSSNIGSIYGVLVDAHSRMEALGMTGNSRFQITDDAKPPLLKKSTTSFSFPSLFASGGFPEDGDLFIANEQALELVGKIGSRTAVANNDQIVQAVSQGVYTAVSKAMQGQNSGGGSYSFNVYIDGKQVNAAVKKAEHERGAKIATAGLVY